MKPYEGGVFITACGELVGPLEDSCLSDFPYKYSFGTFSVWWDGVGIAEYGNPERCPEYDIVAPASSKLNIEDFV